MPALATPKIEAELIELFSSIQGEGELVGYRQIFMRMAHCNLDCAYCDTPFAPQGECRVEVVPGSESFELIPNPVSLDSLIETIRRWMACLPGGHHSLSVTGGEPLVQVGLLEAWLPALRELLPIYLETNGTLPSALERVLPHIDWVSMDLKLPSQTQLAPCWKEHREFLALAAQKNCYVKAVVGSDTPDDELLTAARLVRDVAPEICLILQPVTTTRGIQMNSKQLLAMHAMVAAVHPNVRIIPQTHHFLSVL